VNEPHGSRFSKQLYVAENDKVRRYDWDEANLRATNPQKLADLPTGGGHSPAASCFTAARCTSPPDRVATSVLKKIHDAPRDGIQSDGSGQKIFAKGLRNAVGLAVNPKTDTVWVTVNGRDWLGDDLPPETIYDLGKDGGDAGWPYCYGDAYRIKTSPSPETGAAITCSNRRCRCRRTRSAGLGFYAGSQFRPNTGTTSCCLSRVVES